MSKKPNEPTPEVDPAIMAELLETPVIKAQIEGWDPAMIDWYRELLVKDGIYAAYLKERKGKK